MALLVNGGVEQHGKAGKDGRVPGIEGNKADDTVKRQSLK